MGGQPASDGVTALRQRLAVAYTEGPGARLGKLLEELEAANDPSKLDVLQENIFAYGMI